MLFRGETNTTGQHVILGKAKIVANFFKRFTPHLGTIPPTSNRRRSHTCNTRQRILIYVKFHEQRVDVFR